MEMVPAMGGDDLDLISSMTAAYNKWQWRGRDGQWIDMGGAVNVLSKFAVNGKRHERRGKVSKVMQGGAEVVYPDGEIEIIPPGEIKKRVSSPDKKAKAKLSTAPAAVPAPAPASPVEDRIPITPRAKKLAGLVRSRAMSYEPMLSDRLAALIEDEAPGKYAPPGRGEAKLYGFEHRLKTTDSIEEAIERTVNWLRKQPESTGKGDDELYETAAMEHLHDTVRYTVHLPAESFGEDAQHILDRVSTHATDMDFRNTWGTDRAYKGVNVILTMADGFKYEVQFHTVESQIAKDKMHKLYEEQRLYYRGNKRWLELEQQMNAISAKIPMPEGAIGIIPPIGGSVRGSLAQIHAKWYYQLNSPPQSVRNRR